MKIFIFLVFLIFPFAGQAEIYKVVEENGNVVYTDVRPKNTESEKVKLKPLTPIKKISVTNSQSSSRTSSQSEQAGYYSSFEIIEPLNEATIRNKQSFTVQVSTQPKMLAGHKVRLLLDGKAVDTKRGLLFTLKDVERGTHTITAELLDGRRKVIKSSSNRIYVHRTAIPTGPSIQGGQ